jgi:hypothetical protein
MGAWLGALAAGAVLTFSALLPGDARAAQLTASWTDNSGGEATTRLERRLNTETVFAVLADVPPGVTSYVDTAVVEGATYCYRALAYDADGESMYSNEACAAPGLPALAVALTAPSSGATVDGTVSIVASASAGATRIDLLLDGALVGAYTGTSASYSWDTTTTADGAHRWTARAYDGSGVSVTSSAVDVTVSNAAAPADDSTAPPDSSAGGAGPAPGVSVQITAPASGATVDGTVSVTATASGNVSRVALLLDGARVGTYRGTTATYSWKTTKTRNGPHRWTARAYDASARTWVDSAPVDVTVENVVSVQLTAPSPGATVEGTVTVSAVASGNVSRVVLVLDGRRVTGSWGTTHSYAWKTVQSPNGVHRWIALAFNRSTRQWQESAPVDVTVNNP